MSKYSKTWEEFRTDIEVNLDLWGVSTEYEAEYRRTLAYYKTQLAEAEKWLRINPQNEITQAEVARLRIEVREAQKLCDSIRKDNTIFREIAKTASQSENGGFYPVKTGIIRKAFSRYTVYSIDSFKDYFEKGYIDIISTTYETKGEHFNWEDDKDTVKLVLKFEDDKDYKEVYEVGYNGYCRRLSDSETEKIREEERENNERLAAIAAAIAANEEAEKVAIENNHGDYFFWGLLIGIFLLIIFVAASRLAS